MLSNNSSRATSTFGDFRSGRSNAVAAGCGPFPLSFPQERIWFWEQLAPASSLYNVPVALRMRGPLNFQALTKSLNSIVARHEVLRSVFRLEEGQSAQFIRPGLPLVLEVVDISGTPASERELEMSRLVNEEVRRPFNLSRDLLLRARAIRLGEADHALVLTMHHIASDGWSLGILLRELSAAYTAYTRGALPGFPELPLQYADFAVSQRTRDRQIDCHRLLSFWKRQIRADLDPIHVTPDKRRPAIQTFRGARERVMIEPPLAARLVVLGQERKASLFMTLLAALKVLLHRYSGHSEIVVGFPVAGRNRPDTANLIGFFGNTLVSVSDLSANPSFLAFLQQVRDSTLDLFEHDELPFERIVEQIDPQRSASRPPLFQTLFVCETGLVSRADWTGLTVERLDVDTATAKFDLSFLIEEKGEEKDGLEITLEYNTDLFEASSMRMLLDHYHILLRELAANADRPVASIPILSARERRQLVIDWNQTQRPYPRQTVHKLFDEQVERTPDAPAVLCGDDQLTYRELASRANALAAKLERLGVHSGSKVGVIVADRNLEMIVAVLAVLKSGAAYVPLDAKLPQARLDFLIRDAGIHVLLATFALSHLPASGVSVVPIDLSEPSRQTANVCCETASDDPAYLLYTSGSTGVPKAVEVPHRGIARLIFGQDYVQFSPQQVFLQLSPLWFDLSTLEIWGPLLHGGRCVLFPRRVATARELGCTLRKYGVTTLWLTASMFNAIVDEAPEALATLDELLVGGEALSVPHVRRALKLLPNVHLINGYGPTENTTFTTAFRIPRDLPEDVTSIPIGQPIANTTVYILDRHLEPVPIGVPGELCTGGPGLALGYFARPALTAQNFVPNPFEEGVLYRTGDRARYRPDGNIEFLGRFDDQVKIRGCRVELGEIEAVLAKHPNVKSAAVVLSTAAEGLQCIVAHVVPRHPSMDLSEDLRAFLARHLPDYMIPTKFVVWDGLPLLSSGKLDRGALAERDRLQPEPVGPIVLPRDGLENRLVKIWQKILEKQPLGIKDNFFSLGGNSLAAIRMMAAVERAFGQKLDVSVLLGAQTIEQLAARLKGTHASSTGPAQGAAASN